MLKFWYFQERVQFWSWILPAQRLGEIRISILSENLGYPYLVCKNIRIFRGCEVRIENSARGSLFGITRLCRVMPNSDPEGQSFLYAPNNHDRFFFLHTFWSPAFDFNVGVAINESRSNALTSAILIVDVTRTSTPNVLKTTRVVIRF